MREIQTQALVCEKGMQIKHINGPATVEVEFTVLCNYKWCKNE